MKNPRNMTTIAAIFFILLTVMELSAGQEFVKHEYGSGNANAITATNDGNYLIAGGRRILFLKIKPNGDTIWSKSYKGLSAELMGITRTSDGGFLALGGTNFNEAGTANLMLIKIMSNGDTIWTRTYQEIYANPSIPYTMIGTKDGGFLIAGWFSEYTSPNWGIGKINPKGDVIWKKSSIRLINSFVALQDGNYLGAYSNHLIKIKPDGTTIWDKIYDERAEIQTVLATDNGNAIAGGYIYYNYPTGNDIYVIKIKPNGDTLWTKIFAQEGDQYVGALTAMPDRTFMVTSHTWPLSGFFSIDFQKVSPNGDTLWSAHASTDSIVPYIRGVVCSQEGALLVYGTFNPLFDKTMFSLLLIGDTTGIAAPLLQGNRIPAPSSISIKQFSSVISFSLPMKQGALSIFDVRGKHVENLTVSGNSALWHGPTVPGRYVARTWNGKQYIEKAFSIIK
jgi:hypothetical protein